MKILVALSLVVLSVASIAESVHRSDKNANLAVMLAYRPNSEIRMKDKNRSWVYKVGGESESHENINAELLEELIKERYVQRVGDERRTVKRENVCENCGGSNEDSEEIEEAKVVEVENQNATCKQNVYNKVLSELQKALKSEIKNYKKCVCQKKPTTTTTTTTEAPEIEEAQDENLDSRKVDLEEEEDQRLGSAVNNEQELEDALKNKGKDVICFPRQYAFMLNKLLKRVPCNKTDDFNSVQEKPVKVDIKPEYQDEDFEETPRAERNNKKYSVEESESVEIDVSEFKPSTRSNMKATTARARTANFKPTTTTTKPKTTTTRRTTTTTKIPFRKLTTTKPIKKPSKSKNQIEDQPKPEEEKLSERILALIKEHEAKNQKPVSSKKKRHQSPPKKIVIKPKEIPVEEKSAEDLEEFSEQEFAAKLQELFKKYQIESDETFPMQSREHSGESTSPMPARKLVKKSAGRNVVAEASDESAEGSFRLQARNAEKSRHSSWEGAGKTRSGSSRDETAGKFAKNDTGSGSKKTGSGSKKTGSGKSTGSSKDSKKSYRTSARLEDEENRSEAEPAHVSRSHHKTSAKNARAHVDHQAAADFAQKISDFARGNSS